MLKRNEMLARKNIKKHKRLVLRLEALYLVKKTHFAFTLAQYQNSDQEKKVIFKVFVFKKLQDLVKLRNTKTFFFFFLTSMLRFKNKFLCEKSKVMQLKNKLGITVILRFGYFL